jgi:fatty-acyl-CoA synthase
MSTSLPITATNKVLKRGLRAERWNCGEPVLWRPEKGRSYRLLAAAEAAELEDSVDGRVL